MSIKTKILVGVAVLVVLAGVATLAIPPVGYNEGHQPVQPIPYDHSLHAGKYQIACQYCHTTADRGRHASVPAVSICLNCHNTIPTQKPELIEKLKQINETDGRLPWIKVHMLPDYVMFNHSRHVNKGVACQTCHGPVQEMQTVYQQTDLSMGWCVNCHRKPENNAPTSCSTCHY